MYRTRIITAAVAVLTASLLAAPSAGADPAKAGTASAYGASIDLAGQNVITEPVAASTLAEEDVAETVVDVPASPLAVSGTLTASAAVHAASDLESLLLVNEQATPGPYNARSFGEIEGAQVLLDAVGPGVPLVRADAVRAEAVAVCVGDTVTYAAQSEIVNLDVGGQDVPLNAPVEQIIDQLNGILEDTGLEQVVDIERNVVTATATGASVDALRVTVLSAAGAAPLGTVVLGHAEVADVTCGALPQCSDTADNDDPEDDLADQADPGCHTDGNADNPDSYDPDDDDETNDEQIIDDGSGPPAAPVATPTESSLPRTGGDAKLAGAMLAGLLGLGALELVRRRQSV